MSDDKPEVKKDDSLFESKLYFDLSRAVDEVKTEFAYGGFIDKTASSAKLVGKSAANVGVFAGMFGIEFVKRMAKTAAEQKK